MDIDDLSNETYQGVIIRTKRFIHDLTLQFGVMASSYKNEEEYLKNAKGLINEIKEFDKYDLEYNFLGNIPNITQLHNAFDRRS